MSTLSTRVALYVATLYAAMRRARSGQGLVEYAAILGFVAACLVIVLLYLEPAIASSLNNVANSFK